MATSENQRTWDTMTSAEHACENCGDAFRGRSLSGRPLCAPCEGRQHARDSHAAIVIARARQRCSAPDAAILHRLLLEGSSLQTIAERLCMSEDEVRSRLTVAMASLRGGAP
jgi:DNA-directed RNA polymerase specialized sigma24 family protein